MKNPCFIRLVGVMPSLVDRCADLAELIYRIPYHSVGTLL
jgi:hypothetical protein